MGEIADDIISGLCCALCGQYFIDKDNNIYEHGYPVACNDCYEDECGYGKQDDNILIL